MREFLQVLRRFIPPYKKYLMLSILFNVLSVILNVFSFAALIPILQILFKTGDSETVTSLMAWDWHNVKEVLMNNMNYYVNQLIADLGPTTTLLVIGLFLAVMTFLKTGAYFLSSATIILSVPVWCATSATNFTTKSRRSRWASSPRSARATSSRA